jgi:hypothetical protein
MEQAGRVRGGVKPSGGWETLETDRSRVRQARRMERGFPVLGALEGTKAQGGTAHARAARARWWRGGHTLEGAQLRERRGSSSEGPGPRPEDLDAHGAGWTQPGATSSRCRATLQERGGRAQPIRLYGRGIALRESVTP